MHLPYQPGIIFAVGPDAFGAVGMSAVALILAATFAAEVDLERSGVLVVDQTNAYRKQHDLPLLKTNPHLQKAAKYFAEYLAEQELADDEDDGLDHEADGKTPAERAK